MVNFFGFDCKKWIEGTLELPEDLKGFYIDMIVAFYARDGVLPDDDLFMARMLRRNPRLYRNKKRQLLALEKIQIINSFIEPNGCRPVIGKILNKSKSSSAAAKKRWGKKAESQSTGNVTPIHSSYNAPSSGVTHCKQTDQPMQTHMPLETQYKRVEKKDSTPNGVADSAPFNGALAGGHEKIKKRLFTDCVEFLVSNGSKEASARSMIGKWLRNWPGEPDVVLKAFIAADDAGAVDPIPYIRKVLRQWNMEKEGNKLI